MITRGEIKNDVMVKADISTSEAFITDDILNDWIDQAHKWASGYRKWTSTEGRSSTTFASLATNADGILEANYPEGWKADSIRKMRIGGKRVDKKEFYKFLDFLEDFPSDTSRIFSDFGMVYYINPNIDVSGTIAVWGQYTPATLDSTDEEAKTVFSGNEEEANEAIVEKVLSFIRKREKDSNRAIIHEQNAKTILENLWTKISDEQFAYQSPDNDGMFERMDIVNGGFKSDLLKRDQFN